MNEQQDKLSPLAHEQLERLRNMEPADRARFLQEFNQADGKLVAASIADEARFQATLDAFSKLGPLPPSLAGLRARASGMGESD